MRSVSAKELHNQTSRVLNEVEKGEPLLITRNGHVVGRIEPTAEPEKTSWSDIMAEVWAAQKRVKRADVRSNPVLAERARRRR